MVLGRFVGGFGWFQVVSGGFRWFLVLVTTEDEDEGPHEDLNEHEVSEEASDSDGGQQEFDESNDEEVEVSADDNNSQGQQDELGTSRNFLFDNVAIWKGGEVQ